MPHQRTLPTGRDPGSALPKARKTRCRAPDKTKPGQPRTRGRQSRVGGRGAPHSLQAPPAASRPSAWTTTTLHPSEPPRDAVMMRRCRVSCKFSRTPRRGSSTQLRSKPSLSASSSTGSQTRPCASLATPSASNECRPSSKGEQSTSTPTRNIGYWRREQQHLQAPAGTHLQPRVHPRRREARRNDV